MTAGKKFNLVLNIVFVILAFLCLFPILLTLSISFSSTESIMQYGYRLIPAKFSVDAYKYIFGDPSTILNASKSVAAVSILVHISA